MAQHRMEPRDEPGRVVRPYAITRGRARHSYTHLALETLVATTLQGEAATGLSAERRAIALLCRDLLSVAEVAARLRLPLEVTRMLVGDLAGQGLVRLYQPAPPSDQPDVALLERVLDGLRNL